MSQTNRGWLGECGPKILNFLQNVSMWTLISLELYEDGAPHHFLDTSWVALHPKCLFFYISSPNRSTRLYSSQHKQLTAKLQMAVKKTSSSLFMIIKYLSSNIHLLRYILSTHTQSFSHWKQHTSNYIDENNVHLRKGSCIMWESRQQLVHRAQESPRDFHGPYNSTKLTPQEL